MTESFKRQEQLIGKEATARLAKKKVAVFGLGGVGSYAAEAVARCGVGEIVLIDGDVVSTSNINRQLCALSSTVGRLKTEVVAERLRDINPAATVTERAEFFSRENAESFELASYDYIIDAVDDVSAKIELAVRASELGIPMISSMGTGNKLDPSAFKLADISRTSVCPLARVMRRELKKRGVLHLPVVYSEELPAPHRPPASIAFVPGAAGLLAASAAIRTLIATE